MLTDLSNFASPVIRYDIADYAECAGACPCGRGLPSLRRIVGRERNLLRRPDGQRYWPKLDVERYREVAPVVEHQLLQREIDLLEMKLVVEQPLTAKQEEDLAGGGQCRHRLSLPHPIHLFRRRDPAQRQRQVRGVPLPASGGRRLALPIEAPFSSVTPAKAGSPGASGKLLAPWPLDSGFRRNDERRKGAST